MGADPRRQVFLGEVRSLIPSTDMDRERARARGWWVYKVDEYADGHVSVGFATARGKRSSVVLQKGRLSLDVVMQLGAILADRK